MFSILALVLLYTEALAQDNEECIDKSPYCSPNDCAVRPGYALQYCRKTCSNCQPFCYNSHFVSCEDSRKPECDSMLKDYCPLLCGVCRANKKFDRKTRKKGCRDKDASCSEITVDTCLSRPGYYMKHCPVKCKNCNGLQCLDSIKIDCAHVRRLGGCKLPLAADYCPRSCSLCSTPLMLADSLPPCKDELDTCEHLAQGGVCEQPYSRNTMRIYCAKSCEFCRDSQYYMNDVFRIPAKGTRRM
ncbi:hypothetical protein Q1695_005284 [Nippostrongylus brasiliensis]|nr:hypothetical protein Q1695_005284 [Nippostrongylus brasiliensis]